jgi:hypothetical protein
MEARKTPFLLLTLTALVAGAALSALLWRFTFLGFQEIHPRGPLLFASLLALFNLYFSGGYLLLVITTITHKELIPFRYAGSKLLKIFYPLTLPLAKILGFSREQLQRSFVAVNNALVRAHKVKVAPSKILLLLPHCLQDAQCPVKLTQDVNNCRRCGTCNIEELVGIADRYGVSLIVATGGTTARRAIADHRPQAVIAVACERDLTSGIRDSYPLPVFGIFNQRPFGYCLNTKVEPDQVREALEIVLGKEEVAPAVIGAEESKEPADGARHC